MGLVISYLLSINWTDFLFDIMEIKLQCLLTELKNLQYVLIFFCLLYILISY
jgi:hypothetical protein